MSLCSEFEIADVSSELARHNSNQQHPNDSEGEDHKVKEGERKRERGKSKLKGARAERHDDQAGERGDGFDRRR